MEHIINLIVEYFEKSDYKATLEYFDKKRVRFYKSDYDTEVIKVIFPKKNEQIAIREIFVSAQLTTHKA